jgi:hypothetical protein
MCTGLLSAPKLCAVLVGAALKAISSFYQPAGHFSYVQYISLFFLAVLNMHKLLLHAVGMFSITAHHPLLQGFH